MQNNKAQWPGIDYETLPWERDPESLIGVSKTARRRISSTYKAAVPLEIAQRDVALDADLSQRIAEVGAEIARFDEAQRQRSFDLPSLLLRSESASSSQIENLTSSARNIALAEISPDAPHNAQLIVGNINAMRQALSGQGAIDLNEILRIHSALMTHNGLASGGALRQEQVWVGGTPYSPHGALFVPPHASRVETCLDDFLAFARRDDLNAIAQAAIAHAQFETIHPFIDGNGRTGRTLLHRMLHNAGLLKYSTLPVSAGLLHNIDSYMDAISAYQQGNPSAVIEQLVDALELACAIGNTVAENIATLIATWEGTMTERAGSAIYRLPNVLVTQPVVSSKYLAEALGTTQRAAKTIINRACEYGMLRPIGNKRRGELYQSDDVVDLLDEASSIQGIRRLLAK